MANNAARTVPNMERTTMIVPKGNASRGYVFERSCCCRQEEVLEDCGWDRTIGWVRQRTNSILALHCLTTGHEIDRDQGLDCWEKRSQGTTVLLVHCNNPMLQICVRVLEAVVPPPFSMLLVNRRIYSTQSPTFGYFSRIN